MKKQIGKMEKVDLKQVWPTEPGHFTPWLADEALELLTEVIGIELALEGQEYPVGPYKADIVCKNIDNTAESSLVVIENQYDKSDHEHIGKLLTYAGNLENATVVVWIAEQFTKEHKSTLNWLNKNTNRGLRFFAVEINLRKIGDSLPAPMFNVVASPENWKKSITDPIKKEKTATQKFQNQYWMSLQEHAKNKKSRIQFQSPQYNNIQVSYIGEYPRYYISSRIKISKKTLSVELTIQDANHSLELLNILKKDREEIEKTIGSELIWEELTGAQTSKAILYKDANPKDENDWENQHNWFINKITRFEEAFKQRIHDIDSDQFDIDITPLDLDDPHLNPSTAEVSKEYE